ncbi:MAG TPA: alanine racemase [Blastocatellia bacterium]|nr:alanine racemase [Blastocatellia bacterium]
MDNLTLGQLATITGGNLAAPTFAGQLIGGVTIDSRRIGKNCVFFPLQGRHVNGHEFVVEALANGVAAAVVAEQWLDRLSGLSDKPLVVVDDSLEALQRLAAWWRTEINGRVIAITGSNGKTVVKDALVHILSEVSSCAGSPDSFNSQIGVPLSVVRVPRSADFAVLEAGVSGVGEMARLERILRPDCGLITNIGFGHISSFGSRSAIAEEKVKLFHRIPKNGWLLVPKEESILTKALESLECRIYRFGLPSEDLPYIENRRVTNNGIQLIIRFPSDDRISLTVNTPSLEIVSDVEMAVCASYLLGVKPEAVQDALSEYAPGNTRMEIWKSPIGFTLINDSCSSDPLSVRAALKSLGAIKAERGRRVFVFGGMRELGGLEAEEHAAVGALAATSNVDTLILVGDDGVEATQEAFKSAAPDRTVIRCKNPKEVKDNLLPSLRGGDTVLVKGPRNMGIASVAREIIEPMGPNRFLVDLQSVNENVMRFKRLVGPKTRILAMVKALAYGSDESRLALELQRMGVDFFGVASADEGGALRRAGIDSQILVMMCTPAEADKAVHYRLTPVIYSFDVVAPLARAAVAQGKTIDVHLEVDTGLGRLGVLPGEAAELARIILATGSLRPAGLMTHFASADDPSQDDITNRQVQGFRRAIASLREMGLSNLICHASATAGTSRVPEAGFDLVRLGLGMYGICPSAEVGKHIDLELAIALVSRLVKINRYQRGDRIGYGGTFTVPYDGFTGGVVPLGYHDGIPRILSNRGSVLVNGSGAPIVGNISMDSMLVDLSDVPAADLGTDVLIYGSYGGYVIRPEAVAQASDTIAYELLARLGPRVQRVFTGEFN